MKFHTSYVPSSPTIFHNYANAALQIISLLYSGSGVFVGLLGVAYYAQIHHIAYFVVVQIFVGVFEVRLSTLLCEVFDSVPSVDRLARSGGSDGELVWEEEQRAILGNMECSHITWQHSWYSYTIDLGSAWKTMVTTQCLLV